MNVNPQGTQTMFQQTTDFAGRLRWYLNGQLHREDGPAVVNPDGHQAWYLYGFLHRNDGPAVICPDGEQQWCLNGQPHREDGPACVWKDGTKSNSAACS